MASIMPPSPFISASAETLPAVDPGKDHYPAGSNIQSSDGDGPKAVKPNAGPAGGVMLEMAPSPSEAFVIDEDALVERMEAIEIEQILRALFARTA